ncbi:MAG: thioesterase [Bdellovibrio sp. ArHS]|uniref:acyl-CoA thioesterase n=1 Tax=Bdellovibrio sp. ArHS TaxID=1569284 RepID=UPI000583ED5B|nr:acyl-CoA thioesterase [Bdellovibrio sp. ArHS]KHD89544.1 MAG: thioesterase [Bdellovibrio sp. ArHS]
MSELSPFKITIKEHHVDSYGHINNATYLQIYEEARWEIITPRGFGFNEIHQKKMGPVILEVNIKFLKEIRLRETITIVSKVVSYKGKIATMLQQMVKEDGSVANEATFVFGLFDMKERRLIEPTAEWKAALGID